MGLGDYAILTGLAIWLIIVVRFIWRRKKQGGCIGCSGENCTVDKCEDCKNQKKHNK